MKNLQKSLQQSSLNKVEGEDAIKLCWCPKNAKSQRRNNTSYCWIFVSMLDSEISFAHKNNSSSMTVALTLLI